MDAMIGTDDNASGAHTKIVKFAWSDAWVLLSVIYAARDAGHADVTRVIAVADAVNHAILTHGELDDGLARLIDAGYVIRDNAEFHASEGAVSAYNEAAATKTGRSQLGVIGQLAQFLKVRERGRSYRPPAIGSGRIVTLRVYNAAVEVYQTRFTEPGPSI